MCSTKGPASAEIGACPLGGGRGASTCVHALYGHCTATAPVLALYKQPEIPAHWQQPLAADIYASKHAHVHDCQQGR